MYEVLFDDGDVIDDIGDGDDRLFHEDVNSVENPTFTSGNDIWVVSPRLFETEEAFFGPHLAHLIVINAIAELLQVFTHYYKSLQRFFELE